MCKQQFYALHKYYKIYLDEKQKMVCAFFEIPRKFTGWNAWRALSPVSGNPAHRSVGISVLCSAQPVLCHNSENCNTINCWTVCNKHFQVPSLLNKSIFSRYSSDFLIYCFFFSFLNCFHYREMIEISLITTCLKCYFFFFCCSCEALQFQILQGFCNLVFFKK